MVYGYSGPVKNFDKFINPKWQAKTSAVSEKQAYSNLIFRYKKEHGMPFNSKVSLPGKVVIIRSDNK